MIRPAVIDAIPAIGAIKPVPVMWTVMVVIRTIATRIIVNNRGRGTPPSIIGNDRHDGRDGNISTTATVISPAIPVTAAHPKAKPKTVGVSRLRKHENRDEERHD